MAQLGSPALSGEQAHLLLLAALVHDRISSHVIPDYWDDLNLLQSPDDRRFQYARRDNPYQRMLPGHAAVRTLVATPRLWAIPTNMYSALFELPDTHEALVAWLAAQEEDRQGVP